MVETNTQAKPEVKPEVKPEAKPEVKPDLVTRVSQVKPEVKPAVETKFNINDLDAEIEKIQDPAVKEQMTGLKKSLLKGENEKYQQIADLRKQYETKLAQSTTWTPDRVKVEMNKPDFIQAAQTVLSGATTETEDGSVLSEKEQKELKQLQNKINLLEQSNSQAQRVSQDAALKTKYANYAPDMVDVVTKDLMEGKVVATREHLWKAIDYDHAVERAYQLGLSDKIVINQEKADGATAVDGSGNVTTSPVLQREKGESVQRFMARSYQTHTAKK